MVHDCLGASSVDWAGKTYEEIRAIGGADGSVLVIPVGSIEQHGNHLPVATDTLLADAVCHEGAERAVETVPLLVTPPIWSGHSPHHLGFGGTLSVDHAHLQALLEDIADTALRNGFGALLAVNGHGGNRSVLGTALSETGIANRDVEVVGVTYFDLAASFIDELRESESGGMGHAGEFETSLMMHLRPELVDEDAMEGTPGETQYHHGRADMFDTGAVTEPFVAFEDRTISGAAGSPEFASAAKGECIFDQLGDELARLITEIHENART